MSVISSKDFKNNLNEFKKWMLEMIRSFVFYLFVNIRKYMNRPLDDTRKTYGLYLFKASKLGFTVHHLHLRAKLRVLPKELNRS